MKKFLLLSLLSGLSLSGSAADRLIPAGYYNSITGLSGAELKTY